MRDTDGNGMDAAATFLGFPTAALPPGRPGLVIIGVAGLVSGRRVPVGPGIADDFTAEAKPGLEVGFGSEAGPAALRRASRRIRASDPYPWGVDAFARCPVRDGGDVAPFSNNLTEQQPAGRQRAEREIDEHAWSLLAASHRLVTLGSDPDITPPLLAAHARAHGRPLNLIAFGAHPELFDVASAAGSIDPESSLRVGVRSGVPGGRETLSADWLLQQGPAATLARIRERAGVGPVYVSFNVDCLDPAFAPGTGMPVVGGASTALALALIRGLGMLDLVGADVVGLVPGRDHGEITALAGAQFARELCGLIALRLSDRAHVP